MDMINKAEKGILGITTKIPFCYDTEELREQFRDNGHWMMFIALNAEYRKVQMELCVVNYLQIMLLPLCHLVKMSGL